MTKGLENGLEEKIEGAGDVYSRKWNNEGQLTTCLKVFDKITNNKKQEK